MGMPNPKKNQISWDLYCWQLKGTAEPPQNALIGQGEGLPPAQTSQRRVSGCYFLYFWLHKVKVGLPVLLFGGMAGCGL